MLPQAFSIAKPPAPAHIPAPRAYDAAWAGAAAEGRVVAVGWAQNSEIRTSSCGPMTRRQVGGLGKTVNRNLPLRAAMSKCANSRHGGLASTGKAVDLKWAWPSVPPVALHPHSSGVSVVVSRTCAEV